MTAKLSDFDRARMADILAGMGDWFSADLLRLCAHADRENLERLRIAFPDHVNAYLDWQLGKGDYAPGGKYGN